MIGLTDSGIHASTTATAASKMSAVYFKGSLVFLANIVAVTMEPP